LTSIPDENYSRKMCTKLDIYVLKFLTMYLEANLSVIRITDPPILLETGLWVLNATFNNISVIS
jgi:hypothetical protein